MTENNQQYGGWLRAPSVNPKKCTMVRVEGGSGSIEKEVQFFPIERGEEMDTTENELLERSKEVENLECQLEESNRPKEIMITPDAAPVLRQSVQQEFQDTLKEIDLELAKYDGNVGTEFQLRAEEGSRSPLSASEGILKVEANEGNIVTDETNHVFSVQEISVPSGGPVRGWKHLAREKAASEQGVSSVTAKRGVQEYLEVLEDLVPAKRRCASVKSFE